MRRSEDNTVTSADIIASGGNTEPMLLPATTTGASVQSSPFGTGIPTPLNSTLADDDNDDVQDTDAFVFDDKVFTSNFGGKNRPKKPTNNLSKLPATKDKTAKAQTLVVTDPEGNVYEYLGQFDGKLDFLTEVYDHIALPPPGSFLYRRETGVQFDGLTEYEYYVGASPETSDLFGISFKKIGKVLKKGLGKAKSLLIKKLPSAKNMLTRLVQHKIEQFKNLQKTEMGDDSDYVGSVIESDGLHYEYVGSNDGDLSFLTEVEPGIKVPMGAFLYRVPTGNSFNGDAEYDYFIGEHPAISNGLGSFFKKIGKGIGKAVKAVGKGVKNAAKWTGKTVKKGVKAAGKGIGKAAKFAAKIGLSALGADPSLLDKTQTTPDQSNGNTSYGTGGSIFGDGGQGGFEGEEYDPETGIYQGTANAPTGQNENIEDIPEPATNNKILIYGLIALVVGAIAYMIYKNKK